MMVPMTLIRDHIEGGCSSQLQAGMTSLNFTEANVVYFPMRGFTRRVLLPQSSFRKPGKYFPNIPRDFVVCTPPPSNVPREENTFAFLKFHLTQLNRTSLHCNVNQTTFKLVTLAACLAPLSSTMPNSGNKASKIFTCIKDLYLYCWF